MKKLLFLLIVLTALSLIFCTNTFADAAIDTEKTEQAPAEEYEENSANLFYQVYSAAIENADKILSALTFLASVALVFTYKRGIIPILNTGLSAIKISTDGFESASLESMKNTEEAISSLNSSFTDCINALVSVSDNVELLSKRLEDLENEKSATADIRTVMLSQIDMLYDVFMNSSLPQYSKDRMGEKIAEMRKSFKVGDADEKL